MGGYRRDIADAILCQRFGVIKTTIGKSSDSVEVGYERMSDSGKRYTSVQSLDLGLAAYPASVLKGIVVELGLGEHFAAICAEIVRRDGWVGPRP